MGQSPERLGLGICGVGWISSPATSVVALTFNGKRESGSPASVRCALAPPPDDQMSPLRYPSSGQPFAPQSVWRLSVLLRIRDQKYAGLRPVGHFCQGKVNDDFRSFLTGELDSAEERKCAALWGNQPRKITDVWLGPHGDICTGRSFSVFYQFDFHLRGKNYWARHRPGPTCASCRQRNREGVHNQALRGVYLDSYLCFDVTSLNFQLTRPVTTRHI